MGGSSSAARVGALCIDEHKCGETYVSNNQTTGFPSCYNEKMSDASELIPTNLIIIQKELTHVYGAWFMDDHFSKSFFDENRRLTA